MNLQSPHPGDPDQVSGTVTIAALRRRHEPGSHRAVTSSLPPLWEAGAAPTRYPPGLRMHSPRLDAP